MLRKLVLVIVLLCASCGGSDGLQTTHDPGSPVSDPQVLADTDTLPALSSLEQQVERSISNDTVTLQGHQWSEKSDNAVEVGSTLELNGPEQAWGIYALGGFGQVTPGSVFASFYTEPGQPCRVYLAVADFSTGHWDFVDAGKDDFSYEFPAGGKYYSDNGICYVAVLRHAAGNAKLYSLTFGRLGDTELEAPSGLSGTGTPGLVSLDWQDVPGASGYNVYRDYDKKFENQLKLNAEPLESSEYADSFLVNGEMYFYRVTAVAAIESAYSGYISVYVPAGQLPAPTNLRLVDSGDDFIEFAWDWEGTSPQSWNVYLSHSADFNLEPPTEKKTIPQGGARQYKYSGLEVGRLYFIRMCARDSSGLQGQMTDALPCLTGDEWEWFDAEEVGDGKEPVSCVIADGQICASYIKDHVVQVALNSGQDQPWTVESTDLDMTETFQDPISGVELPGGGFTGVLDIDYAGGTYLIASVTVAGNDYYAAIGAPGVGWTVERIDIGTAYGMFDVASAGLYGQVAISDNGYNATGNDWELQQYCLYTRAFGADKPWVKQEIRHQPETIPIEFDLEVLDGKLWGSCFDYVDRQLYIWNESDGFTQVTDNPPGTTFGIYTDLERMGDKWVTPGYHGAEEALYFLEDNGGENWDSQLIYKQEGYRTGRNVRMEPFRGGVVCVYMGDRTRDWYCSVLRSSGEWETQLMKIGEIDAYEKADLKVLNEQPVFVLADKITQKVYAIRGNIPFE
ncbi:fibronectin type III domain-containing protein [bacterium]|nr:fibronectin type III domain-containing protein [bacterium]